eukprot:SAG11_NODE_294_length_11142_cov_7.050439_2_plen_81_part_00
MALRDGESGDFRLSPGQQRIQVRCRPPLPHPPAGGGCGRAAPAAQEAKAARESEVERIRADRRDARHAREQLEEVERRGA